MNLKRIFFVSLVLSLLLAACQAKPAPVEPGCFMPANMLPFAFTPDGAAILVRTQTGVQIFNFQEQKEVTMLEAASMPIGAALSPDGGMLAWSLEDHTIELFRIASPAQKMTLTGHSDLVMKLRFSPDGKRLLSASHDGWVRIWDVNTGASLALQPTNPDGYPSEALGIGISPDGSTLATIPFDGPVSLWKLDGLEKIAYLGGSGGYDTSDAVFSTDGRLLASDLATGLYLWRISDGASLLDPPPNSMAVAFSPDGRFLAYAETGEQNRVYLLSVVIRKTETLLRVESILQ